MISAPFDESKPELVVLLLAPPLAPYRVIMRAEKYRADET